MEQVVTLSEVAANHIKQMMEANNATSSYLRLGVQGGGCSGLSYAMGLTAEKTTTDQLFQQHGISIVIEQEDIPILRGTQVDFKEATLGGGFTIENPNAIAACGCGASFRTAEKAGTPSDC